MLSSRVFPLPTQIERDRNDFLRVCNPIARSSAKRYIADRAKYTTSHCGLARRRVIILGPRGSSRGCVHVSRRLRLLSIQHFLYPTRPSGSVGYPPNRVSPRRRPTGSTLNGPESPTPIDPPIFRVVNQRPASQLNYLNPISNLNSSEVSLTHPPPRSTPILSLHPVLLSDTIRAIHL